MYIKRGTKMAADLPQNYKKLALTKLSTNFKEAVSVVSVPLEGPGDDEILVKNRYVGVNATDVNITKGRFYDFNKQSDLGLEGVGDVVKVGKNVKKFKAGDSVAYFCMKAYAEYSCVPEDTAYLIPESRPEYVSLLVSGLTASIGLDKAGRITEGETVLITAAAGGLGHIAVQWAKAAGCHVIGTCSSEAKFKILKDFGCDRIINYKTEDLDQVLTKEYPKGIDVIWETIGGKVFETCVRHLAVKGRLVLIGYISGYKSEEGCPETNLSFLPRQLLFNSSSINGFILFHYKESFHTYFTYLKDRIVNNELRILMDDGKESCGKEFVGLDGIVRAVDHLHGGKSIGKVIVRIE